MKKQVMLILLVLLNGFIVTAQMKQGKVSYSIDLSSGDPEMAMAISMMQGSKMDVYFDGDKSRTDIAMGTIMNITTIIDTKADESLLLSDVMGQKNAMKGSIEEMTSKNKQPDYTVKLEEESKQILGYACKKAVLTDAEGGEMTVWYTTDISVNTKGQMYFNDKMPGFPLEYTMNFQGMEMKMTATSIDKKLAKGLFDMSIPQGYVVEQDQKLTK